MKKGFIIGLVALFTIFSMAMVSCGGDSGDSEKKITISFDYNFEGAPANPANVEITKDSALSSAQIPSLAGIRTGYTGKWYTESTGGSEVTTSYKFGSNATVYAQWTEGTEPGPGPVTGAVEKTYLENNAHVVYKITLPAGKAWADYQALTVDYKIGAAQWAATLDESGTNLRNMRLYGVFQEADFDAEDELGTRYFNTSNANPYIFDNLPDVAGRDWTSIGAVAADTWFTVTYKIDGERANAAATINGAQPYNPGDAAYEGSQTVFYVGVGLTGAGDSKGNYDSVSASKGITSWLRNVTLVGYEAADNVVAEATAFFVSYCDPVVFSARGGENDDVVPNNPYEKVEVPPPPPRGTVLFNLADFADATGLDDIDGIVQSGIPTIAVADGVITVTGRPNDYSCVDLDILGELPLNAADGRFEITMEGITTAGAAVQFAMPNNPWSVWADANADGLGAYSLTAVIPETYTQNVRLREGTTSDFTITKLTVTYKGAWDMVDLDPFTFDLGEFVVEGGSPAAQKGWATNGVDELETDLEFETIVAAYYLVLETCPSNLDGIGGTQLAFQGDGNSWSWKDANFTPGWTTFAHTAEDTIVMVVSLDKFGEVAPDWATFLTGTEGKIFLAYWSSIETDLGLKSAKLTNITPEKPAGAVDFSTGCGYAYIK